MENGCGVSAVENVGDVTKTVDRASYVLSTS